MLSIDWRITLIVVVLTPLSIFVAKFIAEHTYDMFRVQSETRAELTGLVDELIGNEHLVRASVTKAAPRSALTRSTPICRSAA